MGVQRSEENMTMRVLLGIFLAVLVAPAQAEQPMRYSDREVRAVVQRIDERAGQFRKHLDKALDDSSLQGSRREDNINQFVHDFEKAARRLRDHLGDGRRSSADVQEVLDRASAIDPFMRRNRLDEPAERDWALLSADLSDLARMYDVRWGRNRWAGHPADSETAELLARISDRTEEFRRGLDGTLERFRLTDTRHQDEIYRDLRQFTESTARLRERFDAQQAKAGDVKPVLRRAQPVDRLVRRWQLDGRTERTWNALRGDLERLAAIYGLTLRWEA
jgi:hypothetical protein